MDLKKVLFIMSISLLLFGSAYASDGADNFHIDEPYSHVYDGSYYSPYFNQNQDSDIYVFENIDNFIDNDAFNGIYYVIIDEDVNPDKNPDNTAYFTDYDNFQHRDMEVSNQNDEPNIIVFWTETPIILDN